MFDFIRKTELWAALDSGYLDDIQGRHPFHLKTIQDLMVYDRIKDRTDCVIAEIGGGESRILPIMAKRNTCYNIEKFEGVDGGPTGDIEIQNVEIKRVFVGEFSPELADDSIDVLFSVSVIEHIPDDMVADFFLDCERILKPGGLMVHAIDMYLENEPSLYWCDRFDKYYQAVTKSKVLTPLGNINSGPPKFSCDFATNPDHIMHSWRKIAPSLDELRQVAQSSSLLMVFEKN